MFTTKKEGGNIHIMHDGFACSVYSRVALAVDVEGGAYSRAAFNRRYKSRNYTHD